MTEQERITSFINTISMNENKYDIVEFVEHINNLLDYTIDLSFMGKLMKYVEKNEPCIPHKMLVEFGVLSGKNTDNISTDTKRALDGYKMVEGKDYKHRNVAVLQNNKTYHTIEYLLHPRCFKILLMRSKNTLIYAKYYTLLESSIKYYHDYQNNCKESEISKLMKKLDITNAELKQSNAELKQSNSKLDTMVDQNNETNARLEDMQEVQNIICEDRAIKPINKKYHSEFTILESVDKKSYKVIRCQTSRMNGEINKLKSTFPSMLFRRMVPHGVYLWTNIKNDKKIKDCLDSTNRNDFTIKKGVKINDFLDLVGDIDKERFDVYM